MPADRDHDRVAGEPAAVCHLNRMRVDEPGLADPLDEFDATAGDLGADSFDVVRVVRHPHGVGDGGRHIHLGCTAAEPENVGLGIADEAGGPGQGPHGGGAFVDAGSADPFAFDQGYLGAEFGALERGRHPGRPAPDHQEFHDGQDPGQTSVGLFDESVGASCSPAVTLPGADPELLWFQRVSGPGSAEAAGDVVLGRLLAGVGEDFGRVVVLDQPAGLADAGQVEERGPVRDAIIRIRSTPPPCDPVPLRGLTVDQAWSVTGSDEVNHQVVLDRVGACFTGDRPPDRR